LIEEDSKNSNTSSVKSTQSSSDTKSSEPDSPKPKTEPVPLPVRGRTPKARNTPDLCKIIQHQLGSQR
jgi:hypothetical protein